MVVEKFSRHRHQKTDYMTFKNLIFACALFLANAQLHASELTNYLNNLHAFQAGFVQSIFANNNKEKQTSKGLIIVKSPDKFYLEYKILSGLVFAIVLNPLAIKHRS